ncbi:MAG TPA: Rieske (2Fe-2S) protein [Thermoplasmata archaeon]|nr:Rieske (2Fe-2S) protein [Thermoplasmata archaeon]
MTRHLVPATAAPEPGQAIRVTVDGKEVAVFNVGGNLFAIGANCTHVGGPLEEGEVSELVVTCPWHGSQFKLESGAVVEGPAQRPEPAYTVHVEGGGLVFEERS